MQKRKLGNSGLEVSAIGFGSMGLSYQADVVIQNLRFIDFPPLFRGTTAPREEPDGDARGRVEFATRLIALRRAVKWSLNKA